MVGQPIVARLHGFVHGNGKGLGLAGNAAGHHERGAEFAQGTRKRQQNTRQNAAPGQRQRDAPKYGGFGQPQYAGGLLKLRVHAFKCGARGFDDERECDGGGGNGGALPCEDKADIERAFQPLPDDAAFAKQNQQVIAHHRGRQDHGQREHGIEQFTTGKTFAGQQKADCDAENDVDAGGGEGHFER